MVFDISDKEPKVELRVSDNGVGIPAEVVDKLFVEGSSHGETKGSGLGLFMIRKTMER
jgi:signal transduction histidine kinase